MSKSTNMIDLLRSKIYTIVEAPKAKKRMGNLVISALLTATFIGMPLAGILTMPYFWDIFGLNEMSSRIWKMVLFFMGYSVPFSLIIFREYFINKLFKNKEELISLDKESKEYFKDFSDKDIEFLRDNFKKIKEFNNEEVISIISNIDKYKLLLEKEKEKEELFEEIVTT